MVGIFDATCNKVTLAFREFANLTPKSTKESEALMPPDNSNIRLISAFGFFAMSTQLGIFGKISRVTEIFRG
jgi:hypothetical protein